MEGVGQISLTADQLRFIELLVSRHGAVASVDIEDRGKEGLQVTLFDKTGERVGAQTVTPGENELPY